MKNNNSNSLWGNSLRFLPWSKKEDLTEIEKLLLSTNEEWYIAKHASNINEIKFLNNIKIDRCRKCGSSNIVKNGFYNSKLQKFHCKDCGKNFSPITNTIFDSRKIPISEWLEYIIHLLEFHSVKSSSRDNKNAETTGKYWLIKVFSVLKNIQNDTLLEGNIYIDEIFFPIIKNKTITKDGKELRGISKNKICVATALDNHNHFLFIVEHTSKPSDRSTWNALGKHIKPDSHLIHDGERSHGILIRRLNLTEEYYKTDYTKRLKDEDNPLKPINHIHALAKRFMREHGGYDRNNLQDWMNLLVFIFSQPKNRYEKITKFIEMALDSPKKVKYRDVIKYKRHK